MNDELELPGIAGELQRECSLKAAIGLVEWRGGGVIYVPERYVMGHPIEQHCGREAFVWLIEHYPHEYLQVPRCHRARVRLKDAAILDLHTNHDKSLAWLAREYGMTIRGIQLCLERARGSDYSPQEDLFGLR